MTELLRLFRSKDRARVDQITNIRMSKLDRLLESARAKTNWSDMAKMLFMNDDDLGRHKERGKFLTAEFNSPQWSKEQLRFVLLLTIILAIAENRAQEIYERDFSQRCDQISQTHGLQDNQYWSAEEIPSEWQKLNVEFEQVSHQILIGTLREYDQNEVADLVRDQGTQQIFEVIRNIQVTRLMGAEC